ncbi:MAG: hypothetical protein WCR24_07150 [Candidatus Methanomethylophilaceae archaeon]
MISLPKLPTKWTVYCAVFLITAIAAWNIRASSVVVFGALVAVLYSWKRNMYLGLLVMGAIAALGLYCAV